MPTSKLLKSRRFKLDECSSPTKNDKTEVHLKHNILFFSSPLQFIINQTEMSEIDSHNQHQQYAYNSLQKRLHLIKMVMEQYSSIGKAATELGIKLSTAKLIIKKYKTQGKIYVSKNERNQLPSSSQQPCLMEKQVNQYNAIHSSFAPIECQDGYCNPSTIACPQVNCYLLPTYPLYFYYFGSEF